MAQSIILQDAVLRNYLETFHGHFSAPSGNTLSPY